VSGIVGLIPAAGKAERIDGLPKYLLPSKDGFLLEELCDRMLAGGAEQILIGANPENRAIIERYAPKEAVVYSVNTSNMSQTLLAARTWCGNRNVVFGMPDTYWTPKYIFDGMVEALGEVPVAAACWRARDDQLVGKLGMVRIEYKFLDKGYTVQTPVITDVVDKPARVTYKDAWGALAWRPEFWDCVQVGDAHIGYAIQRALARQMTVRAMMQEGSYWDCGTRAEYFRLARFF
jgi:UTP-glucose-1-phosphate uridylyltransferase